MWSTFADHGTVNPYTFDVHNADHHGAATRVVEDAIRRRGGAPPGQEVVNAYGNTDEGDQSAGLERRGPAWADEVGRIEAAAMLRAWEEAGRAMSREPVLDTRWTRVCFCGQETGGGRGDETGVTGLPLFTGPEEGRRPLYDVTHVPFDGPRSPVLDPEPSRKIQVSRAGEGELPMAVPLRALRVGDRLVVSIPGEMAVGMGERVRDAAVAAGGLEVLRAVISGLANEFLQYFTT